MARVSMDIKEMPKSILGYTCILVCVCEYTNWVKAIPLVDQKSGTIADAIFFRIICEYGTPKAIICDDYTEHPVKKHHPTSEQQHSHIRHKQVSQTGVG